MGGGISVFRRVSGAGLWIGILATTAGLSPWLSAQERSLKWEGHYRLVDGKVQGRPIDDAARKATYQIDAKSITIKGNGVTFIIQYHLDTSKEPIGIDMVITQGPEGTKGSKALGIVALQGNQLKLAYSLRERPSDFTGKEGMYFLLEKQASK
jgi:uncharacterized protein (TIGR03067 family)